MPGPTLLPADTPRTLVLGGAVASGPGADDPSGRATPRAALRAQGPEDWELEVALSRDPQVRRWTFYPAELDEDGARARGRRAEQWWAAREAARYVVVDDEGPAGTAGLAVPHGVPEVSYALLPDRRGRGLATRATEALTAWALHAGFPAVHLLTIEGNTASEAVAARAGFVRAGTTTAVRRGVLEHLTRWERTA